MCRCIIQGLWKVFNIQLLKECCSLVMSINIYYFSTMKSHISMSYDWSMYICMYVHVLIWQIVGTGNILLLYVSTHRPMGDALIIITLSTCALMDNFLGNVLSLVSRHMCSSVAVSIVKYSHGKEYESV